MNTKHTPGPWRQWPSEDEVSTWSVMPEQWNGFANDKGFALIARISKWSAESKERMEEAQANARLIAAAPELLEALENLENDDGIIPAHAWELVQSAIAKATR